MSHMHRCTVKVLFQQIVIPLLACLGSLAPRRLLLRFGAALHPVLKKIIAGCKMVRVVMFQSSFERVHTCRISVTLINMFFCVSS